MPSQWGRKNLDVMGLQFTGHDAARVGLLLSASFPFTDVFMDGTLLGIES